MGRRKIEIQPITHERNRSVTFLKRKNGLFKKAYELGVLCSVDVAVIIFEERPGHHVKLYQYSSGDVNNIVQRHLRFEGERDTRGPADFSGNKVEDAAEDDEDGDEDETSRPKVNGKLVRSRANGSNGTSGGSTQQTHSPTTDIAGMDVSCFSFARCVSNVQT
ncbi:SRF-like protein [Panus rudis PR-1116 ss-1]|nr:SRF-like protein [Panus rudis PR-1116 ss-1]